MVYADLTQVLSETNTKMVTYLLFILVNLCLLLSTTLTVFQLVGIFIYVVILKNSPCFVWELYIQLEKE